MRIISKKSECVLTEYGRYRLNYELLESMEADREERGAFYGIRISQVNERNRYLFDICQIKGITDEITEAKALFARAVEGLVMPVSLPDFIDDWQASLEMV